MSEVLTPKFRVSFPAVVKAKLNKLNGKEEFGLVALFPKNADLSGLKALAAAAAKKKWGDKVPANIRSPFRSHDEKAKIDEATGKKTYPPGYEAGGTFINLKAKQAPGVVNEKAERIFDEKDFYPGCYAHAYVTAYAYDQLGNKGISFGLGNIQKLGDGDSISGRASAENQFAPVSGFDSASSEASSMFD